MTPCVPAPWEALLCESDRLASAALPAKAVRMVMPLVLPHLPSADMLEGMEL
jgi:hypothetical protein